MDLAVTRLVEDAVVMEDDQLVTAVRSLFGWRRAGGDIRAGVAQAVDRCLRSGRLERTGAGALRPVR